MSCYAECPFRYPDYRQYVLTHPHTKLTSKATAEHFLKTIKNVIAHRGYFTTTDLYAYQMCDEVQSFGISFTSGWTDPGAFALERINEECNVWTLSIKNPINLEEETNNERE